MQLIFQVFVLCIHASVSSSAVGSVLTRNAAKLSHYILRMVVKMRYKIMCMVMIGYN